MCLTVCAYKVTTHCIQQQQQHLEEEDKEEGRLVRSSSSTLAAAAPATGAVHMLKHMLYSHVLQLAPQLALCSSTPTPNNSSSRGGNKKHSS